MIPLLKCIDMDRIVSICEGLDLSPIRFESNFLGGRRPDDDLLQGPQVEVKISHEVAQIEDWIDNQLSGAMEGDLSSSFCPEQWQWWLLWIKLEVLL